MKGGGVMSLREKEEVVGAPSVAEANRLRTLINRHKPPEGVQGWNAEYGDDSSGEPGVWIRFHDDEAYGTSREKIRELADFFNEIRTALLKAGIRPYPYVRYRDPPR